MYHSWSWQSSGTGAQVEQWLYPTCNEGWSMYSCTCYLLSQASGSWDKGRTDCKNRGADLVVINSPEEQTFLTTFTKKSTWIGLTDRKTEGSWVWVDGTPLTFYWANNQSDNGGGSTRWGEEDCNDLSCTTSLQWICGKTTIR
uniref:C-type lectin domain-containing protein n=1 Tax=Stegastes partitus TaxID=144197 RepID=A0A3B5AJH0_9TELE